MGRELRQSMATMSPNPNASGPATVSMTPFSAGKIGGNGSTGADMEIDQNENENENTNHKLDDLKDYGQHIRASPLNERVQNELISIWKRKDLEKSIQNLESELSATKIQLKAKRALIAHFEALIGGQQNEQKMALEQLGDFKKIINLYSVLTATKIERKPISNLHANDDGNESESKEQELIPKQEAYSCRTVHRERGSMMEYLLSFGRNDEQTEAEQGGPSPFLDYQLISVHNLDERPLNESLSSNITFFEKNAPLFMNTVIRQMFGK